MSISDSTVRLYRIACLTFVFAVVSRDANGSPISHFPFAETERAERARTTSDMTRGVFLGEPTNDFPQETFGTEGTMMIVTGRIADAFSESEGGSVKRLDSDGSWKWTAETTLSVDHDIEDLDDENEEQRNGTTVQPRRDEEPEPGWRCDNVFSTLSFWGAIPGSRARAYDRAVISYNVSQIILNVILIVIGLSVLCHKPINPIVFRPLGLAIMFLTISSTFWLVAISFDMTLAITRFRVARSTSPSLAGSREEERKKFWTYAGWTWGGAFLPTAFVCVLESLPTSFLSENSPIRANFEAFDRGVNLSLIVYVVGLPILACLANSGLFCYTTYKMILIRRSTALATASSTAGHEKTLGKRYLLFLRLYLLMDAPWLTSGLAAAFPDLWILKFLRMIQPMLMLLAILPSQPISCAFQCFNFTRK